MKKISLNNIKLDSSMLSKEEKRNLAGGRGGPCSDWFECDCTYNPDGSIATYVCCNEHHRACML